MRIRLWLAGTACWAWCLWAWVSPVGGVVPPWEHDMTGISLREAQMRLAGIQAELLRMRAGGVVSAVVQPARSTLGRGRAAMRFGLSDALRARAAVVCAFIDGTPDLPRGAMRALLAERERSGQMLDDSEARAVVVGASDSDVNDAVHADLLRRLTDVPALEGAPFLARFACGQMRAFAAARGLSLRQVRRAMCAESPSTTAACRRPPAGPGASEESGLSPQGKA